MSGNDLLKFCLLGLGTGGVYALSGIGVVIVYRGSGVLNFAQGAIALIGAVVFVELRTSGVGDLWAFALGLLATAAIGALIHILVMWPLRRASAIARVIATLGVLTVLQQVIVLSRGTDIEFVLSFLPNDPVEVTANVILGEDRIWILGIAAALTLGLWALYRFSAFGRLTTAVAESERTTAVLGYSPDIIATANWALGGALAGAAGMLIVPVTGLSVITLTLLIVPAFAAALIGGFRSFPLTLLGGLLVGVIESELTLYAAAPRGGIFSFFAEPGWAGSGPFLVIIAVLVARGRALPLRSHLLERVPRLGDGEIRPLAVLAISGLVGASVYTFGAGWTDACTTTAITALMLLSLVVVTGYCGQLSLAQFALAGIAALVASRLADAAGWPFLLAGLTGVAAAVPVGVAVALPALRTRGVNLAIATLGLALAIEKVVLANPDYTGGPIRGTVVPSPEVFGWDVTSTKHGERYALVALVVLVIAAIAVANLRRGRAGRRLVAVRANERAAAALGVSVFGAKIYAFGLGAAVAGAAGVLLAFRYPHVQFSGYTVLHSITAVLQAVIGGIGFVLGPVIGALFSPSSTLQYLVDKFAGSGDYVVLTSGIVVIATLALTPDGIVAALGALTRAMRGALDRIKERRARHRALEPVTSVGLDDVVPARNSRAGLLEVRDLSVRFGGVQALDGVSLEVRAGEVVGLIGPNGAGKTTLIDAVSGHTRRYGGEVCLDGTPVNRWNARRRARAGIGRSFQSLELFEDLTVLDNLRVACERRDSLAFLTDLVRPGVTRLTPFATTAVREFGLEDALHQRPSQLPYGRRRLAAIARAVAAEPGILLLDEPAAGLDEVESAELGDLVTSLAHDRGLAVLLIEHDVSLIAATCDRVVVMDFGRVIASGVPEDVLRSDRVVEAYLGRRSTDEATPQVEDAKQ